MRSFFAQHVRKTKGRKCIPVLRIEKLAIKHRLIAWDRAWQGGLNLNLSCFLVANPLGPLAKGSERYLVSAEDLPPDVRTAAPGVPLRSCIIDESGGTALEVNWAELARQVCFLDMGSIGSPSKGYLYLAKGCRGWFFLDPPTGVMTSTSSLARMLASHL